MKATTATPGQLTSERRQGTAIRDEQRASPDLETDRGTWSRIHTVRLTVTVSRSLSDTVLRRPGQRSYTARVVSGGTISEHGSERETEAIGKTRDVTKVTCFRWVWRIPCGGRRTSPVLATPTR
jgi:hypothetical protein